MVTMRHSDLNDFADFKGRFRRCQSAESRLSNLRTRRIRTVPVRRRIRGQSAIEAAILLILAAAALMGMFGYVRSALSHQMKNGADGVGHGLLY